MTYKVRILRRAQSDLTEIFRYVQRDAPESAAASVEELLAAIESLATSPTRGPVARDERLQRLGFRFLLVRQHLVFYKVVKSLVRVYRVLHGRRRYQDLL